MDGSRPDTPTTHSECPRPPLRRAKQVGFSTGSPSEKPADGGWKVGEKGGGVGQEQSPQKLCPIGSSRHKQWKCTSSKSFQGPLTTL